MLLFDEVHFIRKQIYLEKARTSVLRMLEIFYIANWQETQKTLSFNCRDLVNELEK